MEAAQIERFVADGFVHLPGAVDGPTVEACRALLWEAIGWSADDPGAWDQPIRWVAGMHHACFVDAMHATAVTDACDALAGPGRWSARDSMGSFPLRFPHAREPDGLGWHIEGSYLPDGARTYWANVRSRDRALLALYLFTDVDEADGPTRLRVGSHLDVPPVLAPYGEAGVSTVRCAADIDAASSHRPVTSAIGAAGDVYLCHPFVVHAAQANHGTRPRFLGQPAIPAGAPYRPDRPDPSPVEATIAAAFP